MENLKSSGNLKIEFKIKLYSKNSEKAMEMYEIFLQIMEMSL